VNDRYFACRSCGLCIDAGYRWGYLELEEPGTVRRQVVVVAVGERADGYWRGTEESAWLATLLPRVREFLGEHRTHNLIYGDVKDVGLIPPKDPDGPTCRELQDEASRPAARPPKACAEGDSGISIEGTFLIL
jgi:hypothetical protein